jgi:hypothetical protein
MVSIFFPFKEFKEFKEFRPRKYLEIIKESKPEVETLGAEVETLGAEVETLGAEVETLGRGGKKKFVFFPIYPRLIHRGEYGKKTKIKVIRSSESSKI